MSQKVIELVRARQQRTRVTLEPTKWTIERQSYRVAAATNGHVYIEFGAATATRIMQSMTNAELEVFISDMLKMRQMQRDILRCRRGANLWIAQPHPTNAGWLVVKHNDVTTPFRPVVCRAKRTKRRPLNPNCKVYGGYANGSADARPTCASCGKPFAVGELAYQAMAAVHGVFGGRPRICQGCCVPHREGIGEVTNANK